MSSELYCEAKKRLGERLTDQSINRTVRALTLLAFDTLRKIVEDEPDIYFNDVKVYYCEICRSKDKCVTYGRLGQTRKAITFVKHIEEHLRLMFPDDFPEKVKVVCKICEMTIDEIYEKDKVLLGVLEEKKETEK